jgi:hypothetical protein
VAFSFFLCVWELHSVAPPVTQTFLHLHFTTLARPAGGLPHGAYSHTEIVGAASSIMFLSSRVGDIWSGPARTGRWKQGGTSGDASGLYKSAYSPGPSKNRSFLGCLLPKLLAL